AFFSASSTRSWTLKPSVAVSLVGGTWRGRSPSGGCDVDMGASLGVLLPSPRLRGEGAGGRGRHFKICKGSPLAPDPAPRKRGEGGKSAPLHTTVTPSPVRQRAAVAGSPAPRTR